MSTPALPPRQGKSQPHYTPTHQPLSQQQYDDEGEEEDHYNIDGFDEDEFEEGGSDYEEPTDIRPPVSQPPRSIGQKAVPPPPVPTAGRRAVPPPPGGPTPARPARAVPQPPTHVPSLPPPRPQQPTSDEDSGEDYSEIPEDKTTKLFNRVTQNHHSMRSGPGDDLGRPLPPPPPGQQYPQEDYEAPTDFPPPPAEEEYEAPEETPMRHAPPPRALPPTPQRGTPQRGPPPGGVPMIGRMNPPPPTPQEDVYEETDDMNDAVYEEEMPPGHGDAGEVYEEMDEVANEARARVPAPPPVPGLRAQAAAPGLPARNEPKKPSTATQGGTKIVDINSMAVRDKLNQLRKPIPTQFQARNDRNNNDNAQEEEVDISSMSIKERMAHLQKKGGGVFESNQKSNKPTPNPPLKTSPVTPVSHSPRMEKPPRVGPQKAAPLVANDNRPLPPPPARENRQSGTSVSSHHSGGSEADNMSISSEEGSGSGVFRPGAGRPLPAVPPPQELEGLYSYQWYFGDIERTEAQRKIEAMQENGAFMVRKSQRGGTENPYTLSVYYKGKVWNLHIRKRRDQKFALGREKPSEAVFTTVPEVVEYHTRHVIVLANNEEIGGEVKLQSSPTKRGKV